MIQEALLVLWGTSNDLEIEHHQTNAAQISSCEKQMYDRILEMGKGHQNILNFIESNSFYSQKSICRTSSNKLCDVDKPALFGLYSQALSEALDEILSPFRNALVDLESKVLANTELGLSFIFGQINDFLSLFSALNRMITNIKDQRLRGCQLLGLIIQYINTGHRDVRNAMLQLFSVVNRVFYNQLSCWLLYGDLRDIYHEFFIQKMDKSELTLNNTPVSGNHSKCTNISNTMPNADFEITACMLPSHMPLSTAQDILFVGRTIVLFSSDPHHTKSAMNLLQVQGNSTRRFTIWGDQEMEFHTMLQDLKNQNSFDMNKFHTVLADIKSCVTEHLWVLTVKEAHVIEELQLIKDFFLIGRGELFLELLRLTAHILEEPPTPVSSRDMNQAFHTAARAVLLTNSSHIDKFSFDLPYVKDYSLTDSEIIREDGWSTIVLKYDVKWPLHLLFTPEVLTRYNSMFRLLIRIKKTQHDLHLLWYEYKLSRGSSLAHLHNKLMFVMDNLQHYLQADVLETNFSKLLEQVKKTSDFETLKNSHNLFLADIMSQAFLLMSPPPKDDVDNGSIVDYSTNPVLRNIMELLYLCDSFCKMTNAVADVEEENYYLGAYTNRFDTILAKLLQLLAALRLQPCGTYLARLLMRLDYNRWFSSKANLTQSVTNMLY